MSIPSFPDDKAVLQVVEAHPLEAGEGDHPLEAEEGDHPLEAEEGDHLLEAEAENRNGTGVRAGGAHQGGAGRRKEACDRHRAGEGHQDEGAGGKENR